MDNATDSNKDFQKYKYIFIGVVIAAVILVFITLISAWYINSKDNNDEKEVAEDIGKDKFYGELQTTGFTESDISWYNLEDGEYQLTYLGEIDSDKIADYEIVTRVFIEPQGEDIDRYWGKCVSISGDLQEEVGGLLKKVGYGNDIPVFDLKKIEEVDESKCSKVYSVEPIGTEKFDGSISGELTRSVRPAYDISYDFELKLTEPSLELSGGSGLLTESIYVSPISSVADEFTNSLDKKVKLEGYLTWGYAESRHFVVTKISEPGAFEETGIIETDKFSIEAEGCEYIPQQGIDSYVGLISCGDGLVLSFDYGWYSDPLETVDNQLRDLETIDGKEAFIIQPNFVETTNGTTGVYFPDLGNSNKLTITVEGLSPMQSEEVVKMFETIKF